MGATPRERRVAGREERHDRLVRADLPQPGPLGRDPRWIAVGDDSTRRSFVRVLDEGGLIWEGDAADTVEEVLRAADAAVETRVREEQGG